MYERVGRARVTNVIRQGTHVFDTRRERGEGQGHRARLTVVDVYLADAAEEDVTFVEIEGLVCQFAI